MTYLLDTLAWSALWGLSGSAIVNEVIEYRRNKHQGRNHGR